MRSVNRAGAGCSCRRDGGLVALLRIRVAGTALPPATSAIANLLADELDTDVVAGVICSQIDEVSSSPR